jgi:hypothetical protein
MTQIVNVLFSWQVFLLAMCLFAVIKAVRAMGTQKDSQGKVVGGWAESRIFKMFLPIYAYLISLGIVFVPGLPMPNEISSTVAAKVLFSIWCAWLSDKAYQVVKNIMEKSFGAKL